MYCTLEAAVKDFCAGKFLILVDAQEREYEGELIVAAEQVPESQRVSICRTGYGYAKSLVTGTAEVLERGLWSSRDDS